MSPPPPFLIRFLGIFPPLDDVCRLLQLDTVDARGINRQLFSYPRSLLLRNREAIDEEEEEEEDSSRFLIHWFI